MSLCSQTYIFTDGEDDELKKKIGKFYERNTAVLSYFYEFFAFVNAGIENTNGLS